MLLEHTKDLLLRDKFFQLPTQQNLTSELSNSSVVGEQEVGVVTVQYDTVALWYRICMIRLRHLHMTTGKNVYGYDCCDAGQHPGTQTDGEKHRQTAF